MRNKNVKYIVIGLVAVLIVVGGILLFTKLSPKVNATLEITNAMKPILEAENRSMNMKLDVAKEEENFGIESKIYAVKESDKNYLVLEQTDATLYVVDNLLLLENGKAFLLTEETNENKSKKNVSKTQSYMELLSVIAAVYDEFEIERTETDNEIRYEIEVTGEQVQKLLKAALYSKADMVQAIENIQVQLTTVDGKLSTIQMDGSANVGGAKIAMSMRMSDFVVLSDGEYQIPQLIQDSVQNVNKAELFCLTEDLYRLIKAVEPLSDMAELRGSMTWMASCGLLDINTTIDLEKLQGMKPDTDSETTTDGANAVTPNDAETAEKLMQVVGALIMEGELSCTEKSDDYVYQLVLEEAAMKQFAETIAPEIVSYVVEFEKGSMELVVSDERLSTISIEIEGAMNILITKVPLSVGVKFQFD